MFIPHENYIMLKQNNKLEQFDIEIIPVRHIDEIIADLFAGKNANLKVVGR